MRRRLLVLLGLAGCGASGPAVDAGLAFGPIGEQVTDGGLQLALQSRPNPPLRGDNTLQLAVHDAAGTPLEGEAVSLQPWMPEMGHGSSVTPTVVAQGGGLYEIDHVELPMPGSWQLRLSLTGKVEGHATFVVQVP